MSAAGTFLAVLGFVAFVRWRSLSERPQRVAIALCGAWILFCTVNLLVRPFESRTLEALRAIPLMVLPLAAFPWRGNPLRKISEAALGRVLVLCAMAIAVSAGYAAWEFFMYERPATAFLRNPIYLAYNFLPLLVFFGEFSQGGRKVGVFTPRLAGFAAVLAGLGILATSSRMALTCALAYLAFRALPRLRNRQSAPAVALGLLLTGAALVSSYRLVPYFHEKVDRGFSLVDRSRHWRFVAWEHNWRVFCEHPLFGVGAERNAIDPVTMPQYAGHWDPGMIYFAHSIYLQSAADSGLVGFVLLFGFGIALAVAFAATRPILAITALSGITENIFNNSKAAHAVFLSVLLAILVEAVVKRGSVAGGAKTAGGTSENVTDAATVKIGASGVTTRNGGGAT